MIRAVLRPTLYVLLFSCGLCACQKEERPDDGPANVLQRFIAGMRGVHGDAEAGQKVFALLWKPARDNLEERARRASALSGRELAPGELIVPSWFALLISPDKLEVRVEGEWAEVTVTEDSGASVQTRCVREEGAWKVALELPPLAPIHSREEVEER